MLSSDRIRKELAGWPAEASVPASYGSGIYSAEWTERVYAELLHRATVLLAHGESVVADASFVSARHRVAATAAAAGVSADLVQLRCAASPEPASRRISTRIGGASDADQAIASQMAALADPWPDATVIDTEPGGTAGLPGGATEQALKVIRPHGACLAALPAIHAARVKRSLLSAVTVQRRAPRPSVDIHHDGAARPASPTGRPLTSLPRTGRISPRART